VKLYLFILFGAVLLKKSKEKTVATEELAKTVGDSPSASILLELIYLVSTDELRVKRRVELIGGGGAYVMLGFADPTATKRRRNASR
jgi:hypothetical protein